MKSTRYASLAEVIEAAKKLNPSLDEGFVVVDANFNRVKVKALAPMHLTLCIYFQSTRSNVCQSAIAICAIKLPWSGAQLYQMIYL